MSFVTFFDQGEVIQGSIDNLDTAAGEGSSLSRSCSPSFVSGA